MRLSFDAHRNWSQLTVVRFMALILNIQANKTYEKTLYASKHHSPERNSA